MAAEPRPGGIVAAAAARRPRGRERGFGRHRSARRPRVRRVPRPHPHRGARRRRRGRRRSGARSPSSVSSRRAKGGPRTSLARTPAGSSGWATPGRHTPQRTVRSVEVSVRPIVWGDRRCGVFTFADVTREREARDALHALERFGATLASSDEFDELVRQGLRDLIAQLDLDFGTVSDDHARRHPLPQLRGRRTGGAAHEDAAAAAPRNRHDGSRGADGPAARRARSSSLRARRARGGGAGHRHHADPPRQDRRRDALRAHRRIAAPPRRAGGRRHGDGHGVRPAPRARARAGHLPTGDRGHPRSHLPGARPRPRTARAGDVRAHGPGRGPRSSVRMRDWPERGGDAGADLGRLPARRRQDRHRRRRPAEARAPHGGGVGPGAASHAERHRADRRHPVPAGRHAAGGAEPPRTLGRPRGYPDALAGAAIPLPARMFSLVHTFDALTNERPYQAPWPVARALREIEREAGARFDPDLVMPFMQAARAWIG
jgi:hypothetical protein